MLPLFKMSPQYRHARFVARAYNLRVKYACKENGVLRQKKVLASLIGCHYETHISENSLTRLIFWRLAAFCRSVACLMLTRLAVAAAPSFFFFVGREAAGVTSSHSAGSALDGSSSDTVGNLAAGISMGSATNLVADVADGGALNAFAGGAFDGGLL